MPRTAKKNQVQKNTDKNAKFRLSGKEIFKLILEAFVTVFIIFAIFLALTIIFILLWQWLTQFIISNWPYDELAILINNIEYVSLTPFIAIVGLLMLITTIVILNWRMRRRIRQYELNHIIQELQFIAQGNFDHRIARPKNQDLAKVVDSIHMMVEATVEAIEEERRVEQSKDELITNVSHDLRTPLTSIIGYLGLVESRQYTSRMQMHEYVHTAYEKAKQMKVLVDDLFEYSQVQPNSRMQLDLVDFDLVQLLEQLAADFEFEASQEGMTIEVHSKQKEVIMRADPNKLVRVFNNLFSNAIKYGSDGDKVQVQVQVIGNMVKILVKNNGKPLDLTKSQKLFERFYREESSRSQEKEGSGLGLAIVQNIVELHDGSVRADVENGWTVFEVVLPLFLSR